MAVYRLSVQTIQRAAGRSVVAAAAYRSGAALTDERLGIAYDFRRKEGIEHTEIIAPAHTPAALLDREPLWNAAERADRRKDSVPAREILVSLPHELNADQRRGLVREFVSEHLVKHGMIADISLHKPDAEGDQRNFHAHILLTTRTVGPEGFGPKNPEWNQPTFVTDARREWARVQNKHLEMALGVRAPKVSEKSLAERGINREPSPKMGPAVTAMDRRYEPTEVRAWLERVRIKNEKTQAAVQDITRSMAPGKTAFVDRSVVDLRAELKVIHEQLKVTRDRFVIEREAIMAPRPASVKSLEFEATKPAFVARRRAEKRLQWLEKRAKERAYKPTRFKEVVAWVRSPLGTLATTIRRAHIDHKHLEEARRDFQSADNSLANMRAWIKSEHGRAWIANRREPAVMEAIEATKKRRTLERKIKRFDVRIVEAERAFLRLDVAKELNIKALRVPEKVLGGEMGDALAKRYIDRINAPAHRAFKAQPAQKVDLAIQKILMPRSPSIMAPSKSRAPVQAVKPSLDIDF